jgi:glucose/arabinose dehydrogenase
MEASMRIQSLALSALLLSAAFALPALAAGLETPWEIALGPEKVLWVPEPMGDSVSQMDLDAGMKSAALAIDEAFGGEEHADLLGLAFPPEFGMGTDHDFVFVAFAYDSGNSGAVEDRRSRIVQYQWDAEAGTLSDPVELLSGIPAGAGKKK